MAGRPKKGEISPERQLKRDRAESDLAYFIELVHPRRLLGNIHRDVISWWTSSSAKNHQLLLLPRDHGKSALIAYRAAWEVVKDPSIRILYISSTSNLATKQLKFIKDILASDTVRLYRPDAVAILDPKRADCDYPYDELCGCGIGFKLIQALAANRDQTIDDLIPYLDLVATAIAADIVPMTGENRVLAYFGLQVINSDPRPGIKAMTHQLKKKTLDITDVVFIIAPRINAAGRIKHGNHALELLTEFDFEQAQQFASEIEAYNAERKDLDQQITKEALNQIEENGEQNRFTSVVFQETWHKGVIGIVASRLIETYYRPTLVFTKSGDKYAASARSVKGFDVYNALEACAEHLEQFGGHMYAAGMTLKPENYTAFKEAFERVVQETIAPEWLEPEISIDAIVDFDEITPKFTRILKQFEPCGPQNMTPVFVSKNVVDTGYGKPMGKEEEHLKLFVRQNNSEGIPAIGFGLGKKYEIVKNKQLFEAAYCIDENEWNDKIELQLRLKDIRI